MAKSEVYEILNKVQEGAIVASKALEDSLKVLMKSMTQLRDNELANLSNDSTQTVEKINALQIPKTIDETRQRGEEVPLRPLTGSKGPSSS